MVLLQKIWERLLRRSAAPAPRPAQNEDRSSMAKLAQLFQQDEPSQGQSN